MLFSGHYKLTILVPILVAVCALVAVLGGSLYWRTSLWLSRRGAIRWSLPALLMLVLFYTLALHMRWQLGAWPASIGEDGFPPLLLAHSFAAGICYVFFLLFTFLAWPWGVLLCLLIRKWRAALGYLAVYGLSWIACAGLMQLAPSQFLYWWRD